jgi:hypothetical protein
VTVFDPFSGTGNSEGFKVLLLVLLLVFLLVLLLLFWIVLFAMVALTSVIFLTYVLLLLLLPLSTSFTEKIYYDLIELSFSSTLKAP